MNAPTPARYLYSSLFSIVDLPELSVSCLRCVALRCVALPQLRFYLGDDNNSMYSLRSLLPQPVVQCTQLSNLMRSIGGSLARMQSLNLSCLLFSGYTTRFVVSVKSLSNGFNFGSSCFAFASNLVTFCGWSGAENRQQVVARWDPFDGFRSVSNLPADLAAFFFTSLETAHLSSARCEFACWQLTKIDLLESKQ